MGIEKKEIGIDESINNGKRWLSSLDTQILKLQKLGGSPELFKEYADMAEQAKQKLDRASVLKNDVKGAPLIEMALNAAEDLYNRCVLIRAKVFEEIVREEKMMSGGLDMRTYYERVVLNSSMATNADKTVKNALSEIESVLDRLDISIEDIQSGDKNALRKGLFILNGDGSIGIKMQNVNAAKYSVEQAMRVAHLLPGLEPLLTKMMKLLTMLQETDPRAPALQQLEGLAKNISNMKGVFDWRPIRAAGLVVTSMITVFGVGLMLNKARKGEGLTMDLGTGIWGLGWLAFRYPEHIFGSKAEKSQETMLMADALTQSADLSEAGKIGIGELPYKIWQTAQDLRKDTKFMNLIKTQQTMGIAELATFITDPKMLEVFQDSFKSNEKGLMASLRVLTAKIPSKEMEKVIENLVRYGRPS